jgi:hypothetical protein
VAQLGHGGRFLLKAAHKFGLFREVRVDDFDGDAAL